MFLETILYALSLGFQIAAAGYGINLLCRARSYRLATGFLALGLGMMAGRYIFSLLRVTNDGCLDQFDAWLSIPISLFLLLGMLKLKRLLIELENQNLLLGEYFKLDALTTAMSRPETFTRASIELEHSFRSKQCVAFLMMDIDHFKKVNDTYGHPAGDVTLTNLVKRCREELRAIDIFGRVGGEEFLIVLPETNADQAYEVAERLRKQVAQKSCAIWGEHEISITISIGISIFDPCVDKSRSTKNILQKCYEACDHAMYQAKKQGRNQTCF